MAAARGIAAVVPESELSEDYIIPSVFNRDVAAVVADAVAAEARRTGLADDGRRGVRLRVGLRPRAAGRAHVLRSLRPAPCA